MLGVTPGIMRLLFQSFPTNTCKNNQPCHAHYPRQLALKQSNNKTTIGSNWDIWLSNSHIRLYYSLHDWRWLISATRFDANLRYQWQIMSDTRSARCNREPIRRAAASAAPPAHWRATYRPASATFLPWTSITGQKRSPTSEGSWEMLRKPRQLRCSQAGTAYNKDISAQSCAAPTRMFHSLSLSTVAEEHFTKVTWKGSPFKPSLTAAGDLPSTSHHTEQSLLSSCTSDYQGGLRV